MHKKTFLHKMFVSHVLKGGWIWNSKLVLEDILERSQNVFARAQKRPHLGHTNYALMRCYDTKSQPEKFHSCKSSKTLENLQRLEVFLFLHLSATAGADGRTPNSCRKRAAQSRLFNIQGTSVTL